MTIRSKLALGLFAIALILLAPLGFALRSLEQLHITTKELRDREFTASLLVSRMRGVTDELRQSEIRLFVVRDSSSLAAARSNVATLRAMADTLHAVDPALPADRVHANLDDLERLAVLEYRAATKHPELADTISSKQFAPSIRRLELELHQAERRLGDRSSQAVNVATERTDAAGRAAAIGLSVAVSVALVVAFLLWRSISRPIRDFDAGMAAVADGNFHYRLPVSTERGDEFGRLAESFRSMQQQLAALDKLKAEFISVASHELKTPINVILGYIQLLGDGVYGPVSGKQQEILRTLDAQARGLSRLVHQLLDVSRFEAGGGKLDVRPLDLEHFLAELEETFHVLSLQRGIQFRIERCGNPPREVVWDPDRMNEVLGNLLSNAFKFTDQGGSVELLVDGTPAAVFLTVRDSGVGIAPGQLPHIFEKFFQASNQDAAAQTGAGLGLAIAKQIVAAHGGEISVESTLGVGTTFHIELPARAGSRRMAQRRRTPVGAHA